MTVPKEEKVDWVRGVGWMVRIGDGGEVGMAEVVLPFDGAPSK